MSRFAALSLQNSPSIKRDESNNMKFNKVQLENKNILSPSNNHDRCISPTKKKVFVSMIKSISTFGKPPPLPKVVSTNSPNKQNQNEHEIIEIMSSPTILEPDELSNTYVYVLYKQSVRWLNLSRTLWSLIALDVYRTVNIENIAQFIDVIDWRAQGKINEEEFSALYSEWISKPTQDKYSKRIIIGIFPIRQILLQKKYSEANLDLFIGIVIHEINLRLLNTSVSFITSSSSNNNNKNNKLKLNDNKGKNNSFSLEICSDRWLSKCEELFFILDAPGYGSLGFDEVFFYCSCVTIGMQGWNNTEEVESDLSLTTLTATTIQFFHNIGANFIIHTRSGANLIKYNHFKGKCEITLAMFKKYLLKQNVSEVALVSLLNHIKTCIERIVRLAHINNAEDLYLSCKPYEDLGNIGSPRLWQQAVLSTATYSNTTTNSNYSNSNAYNSSNSSNLNQIPSIILFLLSDSDRYISGVLRAIELPIDNISFQSKEYSSSSSYTCYYNDINKNDINDNEQNSNSLLDSAISANEELHEVVYRIWKYFKKWGFNISNNTIENNKDQLINAQRDPIYQLILNIVVKYKTLQYLLAAALYDMTVTHFGTKTMLPTTTTNSPGSSNTNTSNSNSLMIVCANLTPDPTSALVSLGFSDSIIDIPEVVHQGNESPPQGLMYSSFTSNSHTSPYHHSESPIQPLHTSSTIDNNYNNSSVSFDDNKKENLLLGEAGLHQQKYVSLQTTPFVNAKVEMSTQYEPDLINQQPDLSKNKTSHSSSNIKTIPLSNSFYSNQDEDANDKQQSHHHHRTSRRSIPNYNNLTSSEELLNSHHSNRKTSEKNPRLIHTAPTPLTTTTTNRTSTTNHTVTYHSSLKIQEERLAIELMNRKVNTSNNTAINSKPNTTNQQRTPSHTPHTKTSLITNNNNNHNNNNTSTIDNKSMNSYTSPKSINSPQSSSYDTSIATSSRLALSDIEADLLHQILTTKDINTQNNLIGKMKYLRIPNEINNKQILSSNNNNQHQSNNSNNKMKHSSPEKMNYDSIVDDSPLQNNNNDSDVDLITISTAPASTIAELLQHSHSQGTAQYAQMLREILRKMSKDDSNLQLKSLEQVIQLGHSIAKQEQQQQVNNSNINNNNNNINNSSPSNIIHFKERKNQLINDNKSNNNHNNDVLNNKNNVLCNDKIEPISIQRLVKVPGSIPDLNKTKIKKVFGHEL